MPTSRALSCPARCPGCSHRHFTQAQSLAQKQDWLISKLARWKPLLAPLDELSPALRLDYRQKACLRARWGGSGWEFGFLARGAGYEYDLIPIPECPVHSPRVREGMRVCREVFPEELPVAFIVFSGELLSLVLKAPLSHFERLGPSFHSMVEGEFKERLCGAGFKGIYLNFNPSAGNRVFAARSWIHLWGEKYGVVKVDHKEYRHGPASFVQILPGVHEKSLQAAAEFMGLGKGDAVLDLCSGIGISLSRWSSMGARVLGVELSGEAVDCSELNAGAGLSLRGRASERIPQMNSWADEVAGRFRLYANPPRAGLEPEVLDWIRGRAATGRGPGRIAYLSCNAISLASDLSALENAGYAVTRIIPYDFFPQTHHVETLATLEYLPSRHC